MTIFLNDSHAGRNGTRAVTSAVPAAAVWEPSGFREGTAEQRGVRTLRPSDRTQRRVEPGPPAPAAETWRDRARHRREAGTTYLLGGLFGLAVVGAAMFGLEGESTHPGGQPAPLDSAVVQAR